MLVTYSIVALSKEEELIGVGVVSGSVAVGSRVPWIEAGVGAVATQALTNPLIGLWVIELVRKGLRASEALREALSRDPNPELRQVAVITVSGDVAIHCGTEIPEEKECLRGKNYACIGNLLTSKEVVREVCVTFQKLSNLPLPERILESLRSGHRVGGDSRGDRSAAMMVAEAIPRRLHPKVKLIDLRIDYGEDPVKALSEAYYRIS